MTERADMHPAQDLGPGWMAKCAASSAADHAAPPQQAAEPPQPAEPQQRDVPPREQHNRLQAAHFDGSAAQQFLDPLPNDIQQVSKGRVCCGSSVGNVHTICTAFSHSRLLPFAMGTEMVHAMTLPTSNLNPRAGLVSVKAGTLPAHSGSSSPKH